METGDRRAKNLDQYGDRVDVNSREFAAKARSRIGPEYQYLVDPSQAQNVGDNEGLYGLLGLNVHTHDDWEGRPRTLEERTRSLDKFGLLEEGADPTKHVYGIGAGASPSTFAHEFRHDKVRNELGNRLYDLRNSVSPEDYAKNIQSVYEHLNKDRGAKVPFKDKEKEVLDLLSNEFRYAIGRHTDINNYNASPALDFLFHPIDYARGNKKTGSVGTLTQGTWQERVDNPFLNFVGAPNLPDPLSTDNEKSRTELEGFIEELNAVQEQANKAAKARQKKAKGGSITMPDGYRAGGRVRIL